LVRQIKIPGLRIQRMFSWALPSGELGGPAGQFYQFANSIRSELSAVSVHPEQPVQSQGFFISDTQTPP